MELQMFCLYNSHGVFSLIYLFENPTPYFIMKICLYNLWKRYLVLKHNCVAQIVPRNQDR
eukprot:UN10619